MLISTENTEDFWAKLLSLPSWERGLKQFSFVRYKYCRLVAPLVGAWIETLIALPHSALLLVAPLVGAWIETIPFQLRDCRLHVAPLVGAWIETRARGCKHSCYRCRSPRGSVD